MSPEVINFAREILRESYCAIITGKTLDNNNAHEMYESISNSLKENLTGIIIDMQELEFLSSAGVGSIIGTVENSREAGGDIVLCNVADTIMHILDVLDLTDYLTIQKTRDDAISFLDNIKS